MRRYGSMILITLVVSACSAGGTSPSPPASTAIPTSSPVASGVASGSAPATSAPPTNPTPGQPTPTPKPTPTLQPTPTPKPVAGWPTVRRAGITMTGAVEDYREDRRLRLSITLTGLAPGESVSLYATGKYSFTWACGVEPEPCGELGCGPTSFRNTQGSAKAVDHAAAGSHGTAVARMELEATPPAESCPTDATAPWWMTQERWEKVRIADPAHGLVLTPDTIERGITF